MILQWGRYKTICVSVAIAILGHIIMVISSVPGVIDKGSAIGPFALSLVIMGLSVKSCLCGSISMTPYSPHRYRHWWFQIQYLAPYRRTI
jgi:dipeptide/tripeptide permease